MLTSGRPTREGAPCPRPTSAAPRRDRVAAPPRRQAGLSAARPPRGAGQAAAPDHRAAGVAAPSPPDRQQDGDQLLRVRDVAASARADAGGRLHEWRSLTDRTYTGRHLPPADPEHAALPTESDVTALYRREQEIKSTDTSVMFMFFAQWFTDSFLRTSRGRTSGRTPRTTRSTCARSTGSTEDKTHMLRSQHGGRLQEPADRRRGVSRVPLPAARARRPTRIQAGVRGLHDERFLIDIDPRRRSRRAKDSVFAVGLEHGNSTIGNTVMNVVFLREHNRIAGVLQRPAPGLGRRTAVPDGPQLS